MKDGSIIDSASEIEELQRNTAIKMPAWTTRLYLPLIVVSVAIR